MFRLCDLVLRCKRETIERNVKRHTCVVTQVLWYGQEFRFYIDVPVSTCSYCLETFAANPLSVDCFPGSPGEAWDVTTAPKEHNPIWFDLDFVTNIEAASNELKRFSVVSWVAWFDIIHKRNLSNIHVDPERLRRCIGDAIREVGYLLSAVSDWPALGVDAYPAGLFSNCGGCWRAGKPCAVEDQQGVVKEEESRSLQSAFIDGNFKTPHLKSQSRVSIVDDTSLPPNHNKFVANSEVIDFMKEDHNQIARDASKTCSDFEADGELGRFSKVYDITGILGLFCRHGYCGVALNMFTGERYAYALMTLYIICIQQGIELEFLWYDINCRFKTRWPKWLHKLREVGFEILPALWGMRFPLPPFHKYAHSASCQEQNNSNNMKGAGRPPGMLVAF